MLSFGLVAATFKFRVFENNDKRLWNLVRITPIIKLYNIPRLDCTESRF